METQLFRAELASIVERHGPLLWRRCRRRTRSRALADRAFLLTLQAVTARGLELRAQEDQLPWLLGVLDELIEHEAGAPVTGPEPTEGSREAELSAAELEQVRREFAMEVDVSELLDRVFVDEPLPRFDGQRRQRLARLLAAVGFVIALLVLWPRREALGPVPESFALIAMVQRGGVVQRESAPRVTVQAGDEVKVEVAVPQTQILSVYVLEQNGLLTELAVGRLFRPGFWVLPQVLHIDPKKRWSARLVAGPPALVRTATATGRFEAVWSMELVSE